MTELIVVLMVAVLILGSLVVTVFGLNESDGTGVHAGYGVEDSGTNAWQ
jgi:hypothetical protein